MTKEQAAIVEASVELHARWKELGMRIEGGDLSTYGPWMNAKAKFFNALEAYYKAPDDDPHLCKTCKHRIGVDLPWECPFMREDDHYITSRDSARKCGQWELYNAPSSKEAEVWEVHDAYEGDGSTETEGCLILALRPVENGKTKYLHPYEIWTDYGSGTRLRIMVLDDKPTDLTDGHPMPGGAL